MFLLFEKSQADAMLLVICPVASFGSIECPMKLKPTKGAGVYVRATRRGTMGLRLLLIELGVPFNMLQHHHPLYMDGAYLQQRSLTRGLINILVISRKPI